MSDIIIPDVLKKGDKAIIVSPSGAIDSLYIDNAKAALERWGLNVSVSRYAKGMCGRYSGTVSDRLLDLQRAMDEEEVKLIFCSRGGYGVVQFLEKLNFSGIRKNPKWLVGYSDITALHCSFLSNGIASIHAPMARHLSEDSADEASLYLKQLLFTGKGKYEVHSHYLNKIGTTKGRLFGGNLAVLTHLVGTPYFSVPDDGILFIEDIGEAAYKIDRMMWNLKLAGILGKVRGLVVGRFADCDEDPLMEKSIYESIKSQVVEYNYPVVFDFPIGHIQENYPLVHGIEYKLEVESRGVGLSCI